MSVLLFILDTLLFCLVCAALLRAWLNAARINLSQQPGPFIMALTDWLVKPLRRGLPMAWQRSRWDTASLAVAALFACLHACALLVVMAWGTASAFDATFWWAMPPLALKLLIKAALQGLLVLALGYAVLSWVQPQSPVYGWLSRLLLPMLSPIRRRLPLIGGVDLSALVFVLLLQVGLMLLA